MRLQQGDRVGPYEIVSALGAGGMGEVYRARDTKLGRDVAIKLLLDLFVNDPDRVARFRREAQVLASLNHPNIAHLYGLDSLDRQPPTRQGPFGGPRRSSPDISANEGGEGPSFSFIVMELVEGPTLAEKLAAVSRLKSQSSGLPLDEALTIAKQIAQGLEAAHEQGIIHRDLKPANIKVREDGTVKVLDFGLAKALDRVGQASPAEAGRYNSAPTLTTPAMTRAGMILGTATYMAPEQARGKVVDKRADIWAFGSVLYEMLTGRVPFARDTTTDTLAAILERDPSWSALPATTPTTIQRLLLRCLDKDPRRRLHDIADARIEIEDVLSGASLTAADIAVAAPQQRPVRLPWSIAVVASLVALIATGALTWNVRTAQQARTTPRISRLTMASSGAAAVTPNGGRILAITPDGTRVVYVGNNGTQLLVRRLDQLDPTAIVTGAAPLNWVVVSPDGQWVGFLEGGSTKKVAITGGPVIPIVTPGRSSDPAWTPDDAFIMGSDDPTVGLQRVPTAGGAVTVLTHPAATRGERSHLWPEMLPGGRAVLFTIAAITGGSMPRRWPCSISRRVQPPCWCGRQPRAVRRERAWLAGARRARRRPPGLHRWWIAACRSVRPRPPRDAWDGGDGTAAAGDVAAGPGEFVVSGNGTLAYVDAPDATSAAASTLVWVDRQGREEPLGAPARGYYQPRVSPDGTRVAVAIEGQGIHIWVWDLARRTLNQVTSDLAEFNPVWTPDGHRLLFFSPPREAGLFWQPADGIGAAERLGSGLPSGVTPDGTHVLFSPSARDLSMMALDSTGQAATALIQTPFNERNGVVSPDGRWLAYESDSSGRFEIYVRPFPNMSVGQRLISAAGGTRPLWAPKGRELFYVALDGALMAEPVDPRGDTWSAGSPAKILEGPYATLRSDSGRSYDVSPDGRRFLLVKRPANQAAAPQIVVVQKLVRRTESARAGSALTQFTTRVQIADCRLQIADFNPQSEISNQQSLRKIARLTIPSRRTSRPPVRPTAARTG